MDTLYATEANARSNLSIMDLGDATRETKDHRPVPVYPDNMYGWGLAPSL